MLMVRRYDGGGEFLNLDLVECAQAFAGEEGDTIVTSDLTSRNIPRSEHSDQIQFLPPH